MDERGFLATVKKNGGYGSQGEASRAAHAVFGTIKSWLPPSSSDMVRKALPRDASQLWQYSPVVFSSDPAPPAAGSDTAPEPTRFIFKVQQLGKYCSSGEARRATNSVFTALSECLSVEPGRFLRQVFPPEVLRASRSGSGWAA